MTDTPYHTYNGFLRYVCDVEHQDDCPAMCECTTDELPPLPWPDGTWPYYLDAGWELVKTTQC